MGRILPGTMWSGVPHGCARQPGVGVGGRHMVLRAQSTPDMGLAAAGRAASAKDASTAYTNPAGMARLDSTQFLLGAGAFVIQSSFDTAPGTTESGGGAILNSALPVSGSPRPGC